MGLGSKWYQIRNKACYIQKVSKKDMLAGCKVSSLSCKRVFRRPEHNATGRPHRIEF